METAEKKNGLSVLAECRGCGNKFEVSRSSGTTTFKREFKSDGRSIFLTYYDCPKCGKRHYVQIDDKKSSEMLKDVSRLFTRSAVAAKKGKSIPSKQRAKFKKNKQHLSDYRMTLMKEWTGKVLHDEQTGCDFVLEFSV